MLLTRRSLFLLLLTALLSAGAAAAPWLGVLAALYLGMVGLALWADWQLSPAPAEFELTRVVDARLSLGAQNLVVVRVENRGRRAVRAILRDESPVQFRTGPLELEQGDGAPAGRGQALLKPRRPAAWRYHVWPPRRGDYAFGDLNLRWWGVLGLVVRQASYPAAVRVKVYPNLLDIRKYELLARRGQLTEMGLRQTRLLGGGTEFERLREYQMDDEFRRIDWKATARRGRPISRQFEVERSQTLFVLLDTGRLMRSPVASPGSDMALAKIDYAVNAALMLSYVAGLRGDQVGLLAFADGVTHYLAPKTGRGQFYRMLATLYAVESQPIAANYARAFAYLAARHKKRSLIVILTDLSSGREARSILADVAPLGARHLPLLVAIGDPSVVRLAQQAPRDSASVYERAAAEQVLEERALILQSLSRRGVLTLDVPANQLTIAIVNKYLEFKARAAL